VSVISVEVQVKGKKPGTSVGIRIGNGVVAFKFDMQSPVTIAQEIEVDGATFYEMMCALGYKR